MKGCIGVRVSPFSLLLFSLLVSSFNYRANSLGERHSLEVREHGVAALAAPVLGAHRQACNFGVVGAVALQDATHHLEEGGRGEEGG